MRPGNPAATGTTGEYARSNSPAVSILVVSYNTRAMTLECLRSLREETTQTTWELIVIDNASSDGSAEAIRTAEPECEVVASDVNLGFAGGNNLAAERAFGRRLLLLNPDTVVLDSAIDKLVAFADAHPKAGIWGGRTVFADHSLNRASCWRRMSAWSLLSQALGLTSIFRSSGFFNPEAMADWDRYGERNVDIVSGCFFLIDHDLWRRLGGFDEAFFMYGEEADLCLRAHAVGARPTVTGEATIMHYGGASERVRAEKLIRLMRAKMLLIHRHWSSASRPLGKALFAAWPLSRAIAWSLLAPLGQRRAQAAQVWREVWRRRREWRPASNAGDAACRDAVGRAGPALPNERPPQQSRRK